MVIPIQYDTAINIYGLGLIERGGADFAVNPTIEAGDAKISRDGTTFVNTTYLPTVTPTGSRSVLLSLSAAETQAKFIVLDLVDDNGDDPKEWEDQRYVFVTFGHASALYTTELEIKQRTDLIAGGKVTAVSPISTASGVLTICRGDDYDSTAGRITVTEQAGEWRVSNLTDWAVYLRLFDIDSPDTLLLNVEGEVVVATGTTKQVAFDVAGSVTGLLSVAPRREGLRWAVRATKDDKVATLVWGDGVVVRT